VRTLGVVTGYRGEAEAHQSGRARVMQASGSQPRALEIGAAAQNPQIRTEAVRLGAIADDDPDAHMPWGTVRSLRRMRLAWRASAQSGKKAL
jgi:hypothetical protein